MNKLEIFFAQEDWDANRSKDKDYLFFPSGALAGSEAVFEKVNKAREKAGQTPLPVIDPKIQMKIGTRYGFAIEKDRFEDMLIKEWHDPPRKSRSDDRIYNVGEGMLRPVASGNRSNVDFIFKYSEEEECFEVLAASSHKSTVHYTHNGNRALITVLTLDGESLIVPDQPGNTTSYPPEFLTLCLVGRKPAIATERREGHQYDGPMQISKEYAKFFNGVIQTKTTDGLNEILLAYATKMQRLNAMDPARTNLRPNQIRQRANTRQPVVQKPWAEPGEFASMLKAIEDDTRVKKIDVQPNATLKVNTNDLDFYDGTRDMKQKIGTFEFVLTEGGVVTFTKFNKRRAHKITAHTYCIAPSLCAYATDTYTNTPRNFNVVLLLGNMLEKYVQAVATGRIDLCVNIILELITTARETDVAYPLVEGGLWCTPKKKKKKAVSKKKKKKLDSIRSRIGKKAKKTKTTSRR